MSETTTTKQPPNIKVLSQDRQHIETSVCVGLVLPFSDVWRHLEEFHTFSSCSRGSHWKSYTMFHWASLKRSRLSSSHSINVWVITETCCLLQFDVLRVSSNLAFPTYLPICPDADLLVPLGHHHSQLCWWGVFFTPRSPKLNW